MYKRNKKVKKNKIKYLSLHWDISKQKMMLLLYIAIFT